MTNSNNGGNWGDTTGGSGNTTKGNGGWNGTPDGPTTTSNNGTWGKTTGTATATSISCGTSVGFEMITQPGCYVCNATGHLLRVYNTFDARNWNSSFGITGNSPFTFTYVSDDPTCSIGDVREWCDSYGLEYNF